MCSDYRYSKRISPIRALDSSLEHFPTRLTRFYGKNLLELNLVEDKIGQLDRKML